MAFEEEFDQQNGCGAAQQGEEEGEMKRTSSALRSSIARYGSNSYYYAHAPLPGAQQGGDVKVLSGPGVVTGGPPVLLERKRVEQAEEAGRKVLSAEEAASAAVAGKALAGYQRIQSYMWTDEGSSVRVYVNLEKIVEGDVAGVCFEKEKVGVAFDAECAALAIQTNAGNYSLVLNRLYQSIDPAKSRVSVRSDRVALALAKEDPDMTWFSLTQSR
ncbi:hypothetical protein BESB_017210 [Besnoitia besnoiti]|uniref:CS domain-containing protein n=1 Tax=Besnoitia besnoiti TaxID=94643 RepID=A0A2A9M9Q5_BESBE|nr:hypothetical protein BESB_017210 [Besnoitia besnoiti]PFH32403.1 hypothetical protein BESB_017210 [Besnoitia besnoiti]